jgi:glycosyltransferase involved in cell wall biosynthesis
MIMTPQTAMADRLIRVTLVHPSLTDYRVPVFRELASRPGLAVRVVYGLSKDIPNSSPEGFRADPSFRWEGSFGGQLIMAHGAEWTYCSPKYSDVVVLRWTPRSLTLLPALLRARHNGVATVLWGHGYSKRERHWWRGMRNWLAQQCSAVVFYDRQTREACVRDGWDPDRLFVALNCICPDKIKLACQSWRERPQQLEHFRRENNIAEGPVVLFVSRLQPANRVDLLVQATALLVRDIPNLKTVIIGNGVAEKERLQALAAKLTVENSVIFVDGTYEEIKLAPWFLSANVFCYPANIGLSLIHAFWYGLPAVTTDNIGVQNPEIAAFKHGVNGLSYTHDNVPALAEVLQQIVTDNTLRQAFSDAALRTVEEEYTIPRMVNGLEAAIRYAAANPSKNSNAHRI